MRLSYAGVRVVAFVLAFAAWSTVLAAAWVSPADAHEGSAVLDVVEAAEQESLQVDLRVRVVYSNDGEPATGAIVSASGSGPNGATTATVRFERDDDDVYVAVVEVPTPGRWVFDLKSAFPPGSGAVTVTVAGIDGPDDGLGLVAFGAAAAAVAAAGALWVLLRRSGPPRKDRARGSP